MESSDAKSPEFLASTNSSQVDRSEGGGGVSDRRFPQVFKDTGTQSPNVRMKIFKNMTEKIIGVGGGGGASTLDPERSKSEVHCICIHVYKLIFIPIIICCTMQISGFAEA